MGRRNVHRIEYILICMVFSIFLTATTAHARKNYLEGTFHGNITTSMLKDNAVLTPDGNLHIEIDEDKTIRYINSKYELTIVQKVDGKEFVINSNQKKAPPAIRASLLTVDGDMKIISTESHAVKVSDGLIFFENSHITLQSPKNCLCSSGSITIRGQAKATTSVSESCIWAQGDILVTGNGRLRAYQLKDNANAIYSKTGKIKVNKGGYVYASGRQGVVTGKGSIIVYGKVVAYAAAGSAISAEENIKLEPESVQAYSDGEYGLWARGHIRIKGGSLIAKGAKGGIWAKYGEVVFRNTGIYKIDSSNGIGIRAYQSISFWDGVVTAKGKSKAVYSKDETIIKPKSISILSPKNAKIKGSTIVKSSGDAATYVKIGAAVTPTPTPAPYKTGTILKDIKGNTYKVLPRESNRLKVTFVSPYKGVSGAVKIADYVTANGNRYYLTAIAAKAFKDNKRITKVTLSQYIETIGVEAFSGCSSLQTVVPYSGLARIGTSAFSQCKKLSQFTLPKKVCKIGGNAFYGCAGMSKLIIKTKLLTAKEIGSNAFKGTPTQITVTVPAGMTKTYRSILCDKGLSGRAIFNES